MDKGLTVPKWVFIVRPKIPQMPQNLSAQFVCPSTKVLDFNEKRLHWASVVRESAFFHISAINKTRVEIGLCFMGHGDKAFCFKKGFLGKEPV